jgi:glycosyltransferase involved in cell wall biosynthesis
MENIKNNLTIIIPCKNEENYIGNLLNDICLQKHIKDVKIIISDANSTDNTLNIVNNYKNKLNIKIIKGGLPAIGRNNAAKISKSEFILFLDSDIRLYDEKIIIKTYDKIKNENLDIITSKLNSNNLIVKLIYKINNLIIYLSKYNKPFAVGMFMMVRKKEFDRLGGFPENSMHCEDFLLSKKFYNKKFDIINSYVYTDNRRFKKMGYIGFIKYFIKNLINRNNNDFFKKDVNYWQ